MNFYTLEDVSPNTIARYHAINGAGAHPTNSGGRHICVIEYLMLTITELRIPPVS